MGTKPAPAGHIVIVANGLFRHNERLTSIAVSADLLIAADGGANWLHDRGIMPHVLVGDFDSVRPEVLAACEAGECTVQRHPADKDETDLELALLEAAARRPARIMVLGALGGRVDHELANILLLAIPQLTGIAVSLYDGTSFLHLCRTHCSIEGRAGDTVSLLPFGGDAEGIVSHGLAYALRDDALRLGPARGVSNVLTEARAEVQVRRGALLIVHTPRQQIEEAPDVG